MRIDLDPCEVEKVARRAATVYKILHLHAIEDESLIDAQESMARIADFLDRLSENTDRMGAERLLRTSQ